jgi:hypothetical protein
MKFVAVLLFALLVSARLSASTQYAAAELR